MFTLLAMFESVVRCKKYSAVTKPRRQQIYLDATPFYHCVTRCVRRAFLCGIDNNTGRSYEHRRHLIEHEMLRLSGIFFLDIAAFSVMSNHYHILLHVNEDDCKASNPMDVAKKWHMLFKGNDLSQRFVKGEFIEPYEQDSLDTLVDLWRARLMNISWFMKALNEKVAREANKEDDCTGHFWQARFKSQPLLDEQAVLSCMAYIDLNPVRAAMAASPETSDHTSAQLRIKHWKDKAENHRTTTQQNADFNDKDLQPESLMPFAGNPRQPMPFGLAYSLIDYLELLDWTGRAIRDDKHGFISSDLPPILTRLQISPKHWLKLATEFESRFKGIAGTAESIKQKCSLFGLTRKQNWRNCKTLFA